MGRMSGFLTVAQVADELMVSPRTVCRWIDAGHLSAVRLPGGRIRISQTAFSAMLEAGSSRPPVGIVATVDEGGE